MDGWRWRKEGAIARRNRNRDVVAETDADEMAVDKHPEYSKSRL